MSEDGPETGPIAADTLRWRSHPVVDDYPRSLLLVAAVIAVCVGVWLSFDGVGYAAIAAAFLLGSLARYFVPTRYELDATGAWVRFLGHGRQMPWAAVRRVGVHPEGVQLSPFERASPLESFRGTFLRFAGNRDEVVSFVERQMAARRPA
ncbi:MAG TPA: hypothetical protein PLE19_05035 [Planctomycetota bacterium]|nr:hypothetical protein [Planctomycetota bacterium]HRR79861.1 hypothetical protein [Planctomycetota bacterium]HRT92937.1 hypothetical protein [Planctomycetota bacterium]